MSKRPANGHVSAPDAIDRVRDARAGLLKAGVWLCLLAPLACLPALPIDETRYLSVGWSMLRDGHWLVPHLNGHWYADKTPLLFWTLLGAWKVFGVHTWAVRIMALLVSALVVALTASLSRRLTHARTTDAAGWMLAGSLGLLLYASSIMFDMLMTLWVVTAMHALLDLDARRGLRGTCLLGAALGLGMLAKGPVVLLPVAGPLLLAPWWSAEARAATARWYLLAAAALVLGIGLFLAWLLPAMHAGGPAYQAALVGRFAGRIEHSFAHARPWWWYLPIVALMALPWLAATRTRLAGLRTLMRDPATRLALTWVLPALLAFTLISGKQPHYLLPLLPALALVGARILSVPDSRLAPGALQIILLLLAALLAGLPWIVARATPAPAQPLLALLALVPLLALAWLRRHPRGTDAATLALAFTAGLSSLVLAAVLAVHPAFDPGPLGADLARAQAAGRPMVWLGINRGLADYAGRLQQPIATLPAAQAVAWARSHPQGLLIADDSDAEPHGVDPWKSYPWLRSARHRIGVWRAADLIAAPPAGSAPASAPAERDRPPGS